MRIAGSRQIHANCMPCSNRIPQSDTWNANIGCYRVIRRKSRHAVFWRATESKWFSHNFWAEHNQWEWQAAGKSIQIAYHAATAVHRVVLEMPVLLQTAEIRHHSRTKSEYGQFYRFSRGGNSFRKHCWRSRRARFRKSRILECKLKQLQSESYILLSSWGKRTTAAPCPLKGLPRRFPDRWRAQQELTDESNGLLMLRHLTMYQWDCHITAIRQLIISVQLNHCNSIFL